MVILWDLLLAAVGRVVAGLRLGWTQKLCWCAGKTRQQLVGLLGIDESKRVTGVGHLGDGRL
jgi:hypothetical protein